MLKTFSGLTTDEQRHSAKGKLKRMWKEEKPAVLYRLMLLMDLDYVQEGEESASECHEAIMRWLDGPVASGREFVTVKGKYAEKSSSSKKKRKRPSGGSSAHKSGSKKKRKSEDGSESDSDGSGSSDSEGDSTPRKSKPSSSSSSKKSKATGSSGSKKNTLRTANSFVVFTSAKREDVRAAHPTLPAQELQRLMAALWKELPAEEKEVYELAAKRLREDALREEKEASQGEGEKKKDVKKSAVRKPASKKQKKSATDTADYGKEGEDGSGSDSEDGSDSGDGTSDEDGSDSGTEDEDDAKDKDGKGGLTAGNTNGSSSKAIEHIDSTNSAAESNASTPSNAAGDTSMKSE